MSSLPQINSTDAHDTAHSRCRCKYEPSYTSTKQENSQTPPDKDIRSSDDVSETLRDIIQQYNTDRDIYTLCQQSVFMSRYTGINYEQSFSDKYSYIADHFTEHQLIYFLSILGQCTCCDRHICSSTRDNPDIAKDCLCACRHYRRVIPHVLLCYNR